MTEEEKEAKLRELLSKGATALVAIAQGVQRFGAALHTAAMAIKEFEQLSSEEARKKAELQQ